MLSRRMIKLAVSTLVWLLDALYNAFCSRAGRRIPARAVVLYYHAVTESERVRFARQMDVLLRLATPVSMSALDRDPDNGYFIMVSFDDGFVSVLKNALPEMETRKIPVTLFVPTGSMGLNPAWIVNDDSLARNDQVISGWMLRQLAGNPLLSIGQYWWITLCQSPQFPHAG